MLRTWKTSYTYMKGKNKTMEIKRKGEIQLILFQKTREKKEMKF